MMKYSFITAITALTAFVSAVPTDYSLGVRAPNQKFTYAATYPGLDQGGAKASDVYKVYFGDGSSAQGWPNKWGSFNSLWKQNLGLIQKSCGWNNWGADMTGPEIKDLRAAILSTSKSTAVDPRFILAIVMQESKGCARVKTTSNGVRNPGLMQGHNGVHTCNDGTDVKLPCPTSQIKGMLMDGTGGTEAGDGLASLLNAAVRANIAAGRPGKNGKSSQPFYQAARLYNSGSTNPDWNNLNNGNGATKCYAMDIANRLTGWTLAKSACE